MKQFKNEHRNRYYGLRVGDTITEHGRTGVVAEYSGWDNNRVSVSFEGEAVFQSVVAEWCTVIERVENKTLLYRYEVRNYSEQYTPELELKEYLVVKSTKCGFWIRIYGMHGPLKFVLSGSGKRFAHTTPELAMEYLKARRKLYAAMLNTQIARNEKVLELIKDL